MKFVKKPVEIEAIQWTGRNREKVITFLGGESPHIIPLDGHEESRFCTATIVTLEGRMHAKPGDWIIRGVKGEVYPCKPDIFALTYEARP